MGNAEYLNAAISLGDRQKVSNTAAQGWITMANRISLLFNVGEEWKSHDSRFDRQEPRLIIKQQIYWTRSGEYQTTAKRMADTLECNFLFDQWTKNIKYPTTVNETDITIDQQEINTYIQSYKSFPHRL